MTNRKSVSSALLSLFILLSGLGANALTSYPIQIGIGAETCYPNTEGLKVCEGFSPRTEEVALEMVPDPDSPISYGYFVKTGTYQKIGFEASVKIIRYDQDFHNDFIILKVVTWSLNTPEDRYVVESEIFTSSPKQLNRANLIGHTIGTDDDYSKIILGIRPTSKP